MTRTVLAAMVLLALPGWAFGQAKPKAPEPGAQVVLNYQYVNRESAAELDAYHRMSVLFETGNQLLNPGAGLELRFRDSQVRTYWIGNDFELFKRSTVHLRMNHTEYADWETSINYLSAYISYHIWWVRLAVGLGYASINFEPENYSNPLDFNTQTPETRFIYDVSLHPVMWDRRLEADFGMKNYNDFEYNGFDDTSFHGELIWNVTDRTAASVFYERRYSSVFISLPTLTRITWIFTLEQRF